MAETNASARVERRDGPGAEDGNAARGPGGGKPRVLIVEDSLTVRMDLRQTFESAEFDVTVCETLAAARAGIARLALSLVVLDVLLPDGDGIDLLREIKSTLCPALPVMLLSTEAEVSDRVPGLNTGADDYVGKPYEAAHVLARARELIGAAADLPKPPAPRLLLIDDSATSRQQFKSILETAGYSVATSESGEEGLRTAFAFRPDAIIVDRVLPGGIDGDTVIQRLKQDATLRNTPCLLLTASTENGEKLRMIETGTDAYLNKEMDVDVFLARVSAPIRADSPAPAVEAPLSSMLGAKRILAVDDSVTDLNALSDELRQEGYDVVQALSGQEALDLLEVQSMDGILLAVRMPGLSGNETCRIIKQRPRVRGIPLLMLTAAEGPEALIEGINSGADDYVPKSGDFTVLKARLRAQLQKKQFADEHRLIREEPHSKEIDAAEARADREIAEAPAARAARGALAAGDLDQFFALSLDMLFISDLEGHIQRLNPAWERTLGFSAAEMCSKAWVEFVHPEDRQRGLEALDRFRSGAEVLQLELRFLAKSGPYKWLVGSAAPALDRGLVFAAMSDITDRKNLEEQLRSQNLKLEERNRRIEAASRMKSEFLSNMSHELRSPLNGIIGFSELLYDGKLGALAARPREFVGRIHASASHLLQLINGVLDLSRIEAGHLEFHPERLLVSQVIEEVTGILSALAAEKRIRIEAEIEVEADDVTIDPGKLRQVLYNYLSNALKFTGENGRAVVRLKSEGAAEFRLEVSDTGIGVSEQDLGRLFVEFQQLDATMAKHYQGTGLGLAVTKRIVEAQGGKVGVASTLGEGSTFFAVLPRIPWKSSVRDRVASVLVIDYQGPDRFLLTRMLESNGYLVETAATCNEAYDKCRTRRFDAITFDLVLPDPPVWEGLLRIRSLERHRKTPVIVIYGSERANLEIPGGVQGFLTKPVRPDHLLEALKQVGVPTRILEPANG